MKDQQSRKLRRIRTTHPAVYLYDNVNKFTWRWRLFCQMLLTLISNRQQRAVYFPKSSKRKLALKNERIKWWPVGIICDLACVNIPLLNLWGIIGKDLRKNKPRKQVPFRLELRMSWKCFISNFRKQRKNTFLWRKQRTEEKQHSLGTEC